MDTLVAFIVAVIVIGLFMRAYLKKQKRIEELALAAEEKGKLRSDGPQSQHPHIDANNCIGCAACTMVCPEGDVLAMLGGKAVIVNGYKCIGHSLCAEVCPVGAITMALMLRVPTPVRCCMIPARMASLSFCCFLHPPAAKSAAKNPSARAIRFMRNSFPGTSRPAYRRFLYWFPWERLPT